MAKKKTSFASPVTTSCRVDDRIYGGETYRAELVLILDEFGSVLVFVRSVPSNSWIETNAAAALIEIHWTARPAKDGWVRPDVPVIEALIEEVTPLLEVVHDGHQIARSYRNSEGSLSDAAVEAYDEILSILNRTEWWTEEGVVDAIDWLEANDWADVPVTANATDEDLRALVAPLMQRAEEEEGFLVHDVYWALNYRRTMLAEAEEE